MEHSKEWNDLYDCKNYWKQGSITGTQYILRKIVQTLEIRQKEQAGCPFNVTFGALFNGPSHILVNYLEECTFVWLFCFLLIKGYTLWSYLLTAAFSLVEMQMTSA